jgi:hypothetical protein
MYPLKAHGVRIARRAGAGAQDGREQPERQNDSSHPAEIFVQPVIGFRVSSVNSIPVGMRRIRGEETGGAVRGADERESSCDCNSLRFPLYHWTPGAVNAVTLNWLRLTTKNIVMIDSGRADSHLHGAHEFGESIVQFCQVHRRILFVEEVPACHRSNRTRLGLE